MKRLICIILLLATAIILCGCDCELVEPTTTETITSTETVTSTDTETTTVTSTETATATETETATETVMEITEVPLEFPEGLVIWFIRPTSQTPIMIADTGDPYQYVYFINWSNYTLDISVSSGPGALYERVENDGVYSFVLFDGHLELNPAGYACVAIFWMGEGAVYLNAVAV